MVTDEPAGGPKGKGGHRADREASRHGPAPDARDLAGGDERMVTIESDDEGGGRTPEEDEDLGELGEALRRHFDPILEEPVPDKLRELLRRTGTGGPQRSGNGSDG
jgi:hypothetical protein